MKRKKALETAARSPWAVVGLLALAAAGFYAREFGRGAAARPANEALAPSSLFPDPNAPPNSAQTEPDPSVGPNPSQRSPNPSVGANPSQQLPDPAIGPNRP